MPASYTSLPTLNVGNPVRASYVASLDANLDGFEARLLERPILLQAGVAGVQSASYIDVPYPLAFVAEGSGNVAITYYSQTTNAATDVQLRLYDVTAAGAVSGSDSTANSTAGSWTTETVSPVAVLDGHEYRLQIKGSNATHPVLGYATLL